MLHVMVNTAKWAELPPSYQAIVKRPRQAANIDMMAQYDAKNPAALKKLVGRRREAAAVSAGGDGSRLQGGERDLCGSDRPPTRRSRRSMTSMTAFRADQYLWFQVSEHTYDTFMMGLQRKKLL